MTDLPRINVQGAARTPGHLTTPPAGLPDAPPMSRPRSAGSRFTALYLYVGVPLVAAAFIFMAVRG